MNFTSLICRKILSMNSLFYNSTLGKPSLIMARSFSCIFNKSCIQGHQDRALICMKPTTLLVPPPAVSVIPNCGLKIKGVLRRRCKACYFVYKEGRKFVMCKNFPKHKQAAMTKRPKNTWILSHACQGKLRPY